MWVLHYPAVHTGLCSLGFVCTVWGFQRTHNQAGPLARLAVSLPWKMVWYFVHCKPWSCLSGALKTPKNPRRQKPQNCLFFLLSLSLQYRITKSLRIKSQRPAIPPPFSFIIAHATRKPRRFVLINNSIIQKDMGNWKYSCYVPLWVSLLFSKLS